MMRIGSERKWNISKPESQMVWSSISRTGEQKRFPIRRLSGGPRHEERRGEKSGKDSKGYPGDHQPLYGSPD